MESLSIRVFSGHFAESTAPAPFSVRHPTAVPIKDADRNKDVKPLAAIDSGQDESFLANRTSQPREKAPTAEGWIALCAQAAVEQDPRKLLELVSEINRLLDARRKRLANETNLANGSIDEAPETKSAK
jgi:hypothetical protein